MYILFAVIFTFIYILLNLSWLKKEKVSFWLYSKESSVLNTKYFKYQFISSIFTCLLITICCIFFTYIRLSETCIVIMVLIFHIINYFIKNIGIKKKYIKI